MASKTKADLLDEAQKAERVPVDASPDDYTREQLEQIVSGDLPVPGAGVMYDEPQIAPDGHVTLSQEDIDARV